MSYYNDGIYGCCNNFGTGQERNTFEKTLFSRGIAEAYYCGEESDRIEKTLLSDRIIAVNYEYDYTVFVQPDVKILAAAFDINIEDTERKTVTAAAETILKCKNIITNDLISAIKEFYANKERFVNGDISFIESYSDQITMNKMISAVNAQLGDDTFETLQAICRDFAYEIDLSEIKEKISERSKKNRCYLSKEKIYKIYQTIVNANCFSRETFAMLYVRLEEYVRKEIALSEFDHKVRTQSLSTVTITEE